MNEEITDVKPPMGFPHITDLAGSEATILQVANSQGDILGYATLDDIDAYIEQKVSKTVHSFSQKQTFQDVTINGTFDGSNVVNQSKLNEALANLDNINFATVRSGTNIDSILTNYKGKVYFQLCDNNSTGTKPSGVTSGIVQTLAWDSGNYATQIYTEIDTNHRMFIRYNNNGNWTSWEKLVTEKTHIETNFSCRYTEQDKLVTCNLYLNVTTQYNAWVNFINLPKPKDGNIMFKVTKDNGETFNFYVISSTGGIQNGTLLPTGRYTGTVTYVSV